MKITASFLIYYVFAIALIPKFFNYKIICLCGDTFSITKKHLLFYKELLNI